MDLHKEAISLQAVPGLVLPRTLLQGTRYLSEMLGNMADIFKLGNMADIFFSLVSDWR